MGNHIQHLSSRVNLVASSDTWIEDKAIQQLEKTAELDGIIKAAGMPDLHPGRGYPIGAAFSTRNIIYPALVGSDIGCGMALWATDIKVRKVNLDKFEKRLSNIDIPLGYEWQALVEQRFIEKNLDKTNFSRSLGTIGGGNHFAELQQITDVYNSTLFDTLKVNNKNLVLLVHSGSRGLGESILRSHIENFGHKGLEVDSESFNGYMARHDQALRFAELNRELIALRMMEQLHAKGEMVLDVNHNLVSSKCIDNAVNWIHRKGATPSDCGLVMIPGSRGDYSYLVQPTGISKVHEDSLYSLAHGAGRKWARSECKDRLSKRYKRSDLERSAFGSRIICKSKDLIYEEAPEAYKSIISVIDTMEDAGLIIKVARLKPVLTYKTQGAC